MARPMIGRGVDGDNGRLPRRFVGQTEYPPGRGGIHVDRLARSPQRALAREAPRA